MELRRTSRRSDLFVLSLAFAALGAVDASAQVLEIGPTGQVATRGAAGAAAAAARPDACSGALAEAFAAAAARTQLSIELLMNVARTESRCNPRAVSPAGAIGVMQLMPATARQLGVNPWNAAENIAGGAEYLRRQIERFDGQLDLALAAYNAGPGAVEREGGTPPFPETRRYVERNLDLLAAISLGNQP